MAFRNKFAGNALCSAGLPPGVHENGRTPQEEGGYPPPPPLPMFEADSHNFASVPLLPRGLKLQSFRGTIGGPWEEGGPSQPPLSYIPAPTPPSSGHGVRRGQHRRSFPSAKRSVSLDTGRP